MESKILPRPPQIVINAIQAINSSRPQLWPPSNPGAHAVDERTGQKGNKIAEEIAIINDPKKPAAVPSGVIPPLVPGGT